MAKLRDSYATQTSANDLASAVQQWLERADPTVLFRTCVTCHHIDPTTSQCKKFKRVPPVAIIAGQTDCNHYSDAEDIPF